MGFLDPQFREKIVYDTSRDARYHLQGLMELNSKLDKINVQIL